MNEKTNSLYITIVLQSYFVFYTLKGLSVIIKLYSLKHQEFVFLTVAAPVNDGWLENNTGDDGVRLFIVQSQETSRDPATEPSPMESNFACINILQLAGQESGTQYTVFTLYIPITLALYCIVVI